MREFSGSVPDHISGWWTPDLWCLHSADWWRQHWTRTGSVEVVTADSMKDGWQLWLDWHRAIAPDNVVEIQAVEADHGTNLGYVRVVGRRAEMTIDEPVVFMTPQYLKRPLLRGAE